MAPLLHTKSNRSPSLTNTITIDGVPFDLSGSTVKLRMRAENSSTLKVDTAASIVTASTTTNGTQVLPIGTLTVVSTTGFLDAGALLVNGAQYVFYTGKTATTFLGCTKGSGSITTGATVAQVGGVQYDWAAIDVDTAGEYLCWFFVTLPSAKTQDTPEFEFVITEHVPTVPNLYVQIEEFKSTIELSGTSFSDEDVKLALRASSRAIDEKLDRRFYPDSDAAQVRYYSPDNYWTLEIDDLVTLTTLKIDRDANGTFEETWTLNTDFNAEPLNAAADSKPWTQICVHPLGNYFLPAGYPRTVELTGKFGWLAAPAAIEQATTLLAHRLLKRARQAPFGISGLGLDGSVVRIMLSDPDVEALIRPFSREVLVA